MTKTAATISIKRPGAMSPKGRKDIAAWLRRTADDLVMKHGKDYDDTGTFRGHYCYRG